MINPRKAFAWFTTIFFVFISTSGIFINFSGEGGARIQREAGFNDLLNVSYFIEGFLMQSRRNLAFFSLTA